MTQWVNERTTADKFCALHFASFRGSIEICKELLALGADMRVRNSYGLNVMHIAAQGNEPISLYFFRKKGMSLTAKDNRGSTPLHWACFQSQELALIYLLGWLKTEQLDF